MVDRACSWVTRNVAVLSIVGALLLQTGALVWWTSKLDSSVKDLKAWQDKREPIVDNLPVMREKFDQQMKILERIECGQKDLNEKLWNHIVNERKLGKGE